jgi:Zn-dependent peptidase ImmA (M78 family)
LFLHPSGEVVHIDRDSVFHVRRRDSESAKGTDPDEREANAFAAELLMPESFLRTDLENVGALDDSAISHLASRYGVSSQALTFRLANLGYRID